MTTPSAAEARSRGRVVRDGLLVLGRAIRTEPHMFTIGVAGSLLFGLLTVGSAYVIGAVVGRVVVPAFDRGDTAPGALAAAVAAIMAISFGKVLGIFGRRLAAGAMQFRLQATYRRRVTRRYLTLPLAWHRRNPTGTLLANANSDVEAAFFPIAPLPFAVGTIGMLIAAIGSLFLIDWAFALVGLAVFPALFGINVIYSRTIAPRVARAQALRGTVSAIAHESFDGAVVVKTMGRESAETDRFAAATGELRDAMISVGRVRGLFDPMLDALPSLGTVAVLLVGAVRMGQGEVSVAEVVSVSFLFTVLAFPVRAIGWVLAELPRSVVGWERVQRVLTADGAMTYGDRALPATGGGAELRFDGVRFAYDPDQPVLRDVSFRVPAARTVALVGPTGAGKSTVATLAAGLVEPAAGHIRLDGTDLRELSHAALADTVALVPQIPFIFDDTVRGNVDLGRDGIDDGTVWAALRMARADGFIAALTDSLDTTVGERGTTLSGGQRQRLALARALVANPRLIILDDATSAVDPRVEAAMFAGLRERAGQTSILIVAYRRATIALADEVIYLDHGRVLAQGSHEVLLATVPGYAALVTAYERADADREREHAFDDADLVLDAGDTDR